MMMALRRAIAGLVLLVAPLPVLAQSELEAEPAEAESGLDVSANVGVVSDYRFRGVSLSDRAPALQGGLDLEGPHFFLGTWASTIADYEGAEVEVDLYGGLQGGSDTFAWAAGVYAYFYPGGTDVNYAELIASAETYVGPITLGVEGSYAPEQDNLDFANKYLGASAALDAGGGFSLLARGGYENGFYEHKWDWELGARYTRGPFAASLSYVDSNYGAADEEGRLARAGIVASLLAEF